MTSVRRKNNTESKQQFQLHCWLWQDNSSSSRLLPHLSINVSNEEISSVFSSLNNRWNSRHKSSVWSQAWCRVCLNTTHERAREIRFERGRQSVVSTMRDSSHILWHLMSLLPLSMAFISLLETRRDDFYPKKKNGSTERFDTSVCIMRYWKVNLKESQISTLYLLSISGETCSEKITKEFIDISSRFSRARLSTLFGFVYYIYSPSLSDVCWRSC